MAIHEGALTQFSQSYLTRGLHRHSDNSVTYQEYAPGVARACLIGEFNHWTLWQHEMQKDAFGVWHLHIPPLENNRCAIPHGSTLKVSV